MFAERNEVYVIFKASCVSVEMVKKFPECVICTSLLFHSDVVYIGSGGFVIQWKLVSDANLRLEGYPGLNPAVFSTWFGLMLF